MKYEFRTVEGRTCCSTDDPTGLCAHCKAALANNSSVHASERDRLGRALQGFGSWQADSAPDPNAPGLKRLRGEQTPPPDDSDALRAMAEFRGQMREQTVTAGLGLPPATGDTYSQPPNAYQTALDKIKEGR